MTLSPLSSLLLVAGIITVGVSVAIVAARAIDDYLWIAEQRSRRPIWEREWERLCAALDPDDFAEPERPVVELFDQDDYET